ncbi:hypothetical protein QCA50_010387 [Cerrena zonata]|uniref:Uncharacterized protein n=1 Tax=Cerrena zonata TaxID=2478898 RepID=A0AAW0G1B1_9APHY
MHSCLLIDEILEKIGGFVGFDDAYNSSMIVHDKKSLLAFILTCHTFAEPGLNILWATIDNIYPLAFTFPTNVIPQIEQGPNGLKTVIGLSPIPGPDDWTLFNRYARRVKALYTSSYTRSGGLRFLTEIALHRPVGTLFPNLRVLGWTDMRQEMVPYISLFMGPALTKVDIEIYSEDMYITFWDSLRHLSPAVQKIDLSSDGYAPSDLAFGSLSRAFCSLRHLTRLNHDGYPLDVLPEHLTSLANIPSLQTLMCCLQRGPNEGSHRMAAIVMEDYFPSLEHLDIHIHDLDSFCAFLTCYRLPKMSFLQFRLQMQPLAKELKQLFETLQDKSQLTTLFVSLELPNNSQPHTSQRYILTDATLLPLFELRLVSSFALDGFPSAITRVSFSRMAEAWPNLEYLAICRRRSLQPIPATDCLHVQDLDIFSPATYPRLRHLGFSLKIEVTDSVEAKISARAIRCVPPEPLTLYFADSDMPDVDAQPEIAAYLTSIFPGVIVENDGFPFARDGFAELVELFNRVRDSERNHSHSTVPEVTDETTI